MRATFTALVFALLFAVGANADVIHQADFENTTTTGLGVGPTGFDFSGSGGGLAANSFGMGNSNANSGSFHYLVDAGNLAPGTAWGGSWSGISSSSNNSSGGFTTQAQAEAAGAGCYIDFQVGTEFTVSAEIATGTGADELSGPGSAAVRLEFYYDIDNTGDGVADGNREITGAAGARDRVGGNGYNETTLLSTYQNSTATHALTASDLDFAALTSLAPANGPWVGEAGADGVLGTSDDEIVLGINRVVAVMGTDGHNGDGPGDGLILYDDFSFEVDSASVVVVGTGHVPEPGTAGLLLAGLLGMSGIRRRKN